MTQSASVGGDTAADFETARDGKTTAPTPYTLGDAPGPLNSEQLRLIDAWWRMANYLAVGQIYLMANPLLREPLRAEHIKPRLLGHFGTVPGLNLLHAHASRLIKERDLDVAYVVGTGHGGPGPNACAWLEGTYSEVYSAVPQDAEGMGALFRQFSFPGGVPSHCAPETPGSFNEGGELGYSPDLHAKLDGKARRLARKDRSTVGFSCSSPAHGLVYATVSDRALSPGPAARSPSLLGRAQPQWHRRERSRPARRSTPATAAARW